MKTSTQTLCTSVLPSHAQAQPEAQSASWPRLLGSSVRAALLVMAVSGIAYPLLTTGVAQALFPQAANGSLIEREGRIVGSALIGQQFNGPQYFHGRPSATVAPDPTQEGANIAAPYNAGLSGASNQGATHKDLSEAVAQRVARYRADNGLASDLVVPVDAVTASASGLDPHISMANAQLQLARVAQARQLPQAKLQELLAQATEQRSLGLLGEPRVNVLQLNLALDALQPATGAVKE
ncbi:potassium-transporting ATPase subunit KdpC [Comamonas thiooxydans]|uniref:potassium-transporting ATPase subunit KdpC n=1 Tax=Comamonas thiooxydans TaxID=363952 RepID=UPI000A2D1CBA|nr:potassium-transporting ATPase subunit KdpC [Comamonas thiooxydans]BDR07194.1 potassium-transporting ATPase subunit KdpC [Comamonas thiooxydans]